MLLSNVTHFTILKNFTDFHTAQKMWKCLFLGIRKKTAFHSGIVKRINPVCELQKNKISFHSNFGCIYKQNSGEPSKQKEEAVITAIITDEIVERELRRVEEWSHDAGEEWVIEWNRGEGGRRKEMTWGHCESLPHYRRQSEKSSLCGRERIITDA